MRKAVLAALVLFIAATVFAASPTCTQPNLVISGIQGEMQAPCAGAIDFTSVVQRTLHDQQQLDW